MTNSSEPQSSNEYDVSSVSVPPPRNSKIINKVICLPFEPSDGLSLKGPLTKPAYFMLLKLLIVISEYKIYALTLADKSFSKSQKRAFHAFIRKNYRNFYNSKHRNKPVYALKLYLLGDFIVNKFNGLPVIIHNSYSKASKTLLESRELVYDEYLDSILEDSHYTTVNGVESCVPGGVNALSKAFNAKFYFKGVFKRIGSFLKACKSCRVNTSLPIDGIG